jgi:Tfp pilus assembly protein PilO
MTLLQRVLREKRPVIAPLMIALLANVAIYVLVVRPLAVRSATASQRAQTAAQSRQNAERDLEAARALVAGKTLAEEELATFYGKILPADLSTARSMTYASLPALAQRTNVRYDARSSAIEPVQNQRLGRLRINMVLEGDYEDVRQFIYELETTPAFVIIDNVTLAQGNPEGPLALTVELSAYYRTGVNGD